MNSDDRDVGRLLRFFSLLPRAEIEALERELAEHPEKREAQRALARDVTARVHGEDAARVAGEVSALLFGGADARSLSLGAVEAPLRSESADVLDLLVSTSLAASRGAAKRLVEQGGVYVNGARVAMNARTIDGGTLLAGGHALLRKGARDYALVRFVGR